MASKFYSGSLDYFLWTYGIFIKNIWIYALVIWWLGVVSQYIFKKYDFLLSKWWFKSPFQTIPYSVIIFTGFLMSFFGEISLAREILWR
jgi:hypothetical protein